MSQLTRLCSARDDSAERRRPVAEDASLGLVCRRPLLCARVEGVRSGATAVASLSHSARAGVVRLLAACACACLCVVGSARACLCCFVVFVFVCCVCCLVCVCVWLAGVCFVCSTALSLLPCAPSVIPA